MDIRTRWRALFVPRHVHHADGSETPAFYIAPAGRVLIGSIVLVVILLALWLA